MSAADDFRNQFDEEGRYRNRDGTLNVVFAMGGGGRYPAKLHFSDGLCVRAEMVRGDDWANLDNSPLNGIYSLLDFGDEKLKGIEIHQGRVTLLDEANGRSTRQAFLGNFRIARNLFVHHRSQADKSCVDPASTAGALARPAIWLAPKSVAGFNAADFRGLGPDHQRELQTAVQDFLAVATQVPADQPATNEQCGNASLAFAKILERLEPVLPLTDESKKVETALGTVDFPSWVVNWDYELDTDSGGMPAVWVTVFADDQSFPPPQLGRAAFELSSKFREALDAFQIDRYPYLRMKTAQEHKAR
jgi:hypothetical protein